MDGTEDDQIKISGIEGYTERYFTLLEDDKERGSESEFSDVDTDYSNDLTESDLPAGNCMFKVNNRNTRTRCEICSKLTIKTPERR